MTHKLLMAVAMVMSSYFTSTISYAQDTLRIGAPLPLTGALAPEGLKLKQGYELWKSEVEKAGGIKIGGKTYSVEIIYADYQSVTPRAVQLTERFAVNDRVNVLFAPFGSGATKAASAVAEKYGIPMIASTASSKEVFDLGYRYLFGVLTENASASDAIGALVKESAKDVKSIAIVARNDLYPLALGTVMEQTAGSLGINVLRFEKYPIGTLDHSSTITTIKALNPDWLFVTGYNNDTILFRTQLSNLKFAPKILTMINGPTYPEWLEALGPLAEGVTTVSWYSTATEYDSADVFGSNKNFSRLFSEKYNGPPDWTQAAGAAIAVVTQMAVERAGTLEGKALRDELAKGGFKTFFGPVSFAEKGIANSYETPVIQIQNGKLEVVYPPNTATRPIKLAK